MEEGVSAYSSTVTAGMVGNFLAGGAAVNQLAAGAGVALTVVDVGVAGDLSSLPQPAGESERERDSGLHREQGRAVRGDPGERRVAERQLPGVQGEPDGQGEHRVQPDESDGRLVRGEELQQVVHQTRSTGRWPKRPRGRTTSTTNSKP